jgi:hypothetical protein
MKLILKLSYITLALLFLQSCTKTGDVTFWQETGSGYGITVVSLNGVTSNITSEYNSAPDCGEAGCAVFNSLEDGVYNYSASDGNYTWSGSVDINSGCLTLELY